MGETNSVTLCLPVHHQGVSVHSSKGDLYKAGIKELNQGVFSMKS